MFTTSCFSLLWGTQPDYISRLLLQQSVATGLSSGRWDVVRSDVCATFMPGPYKLVCDPPHTFSACWLVVGFHSDSGCHKLKMTGPSQLGTSPAIPRPSNVLSLWDLGLKCFTEGFYLASKIIKSSSLCPEDGRVWLPNTQRSVVYYVHLVKALSVPLEPRSSGCLFHKAWRSCRGCPLGSKLGGCSLSSRLRAASNTGPGSVERRGQEWWGRWGLEDAQAEAVGPGGSFHRE